MDDSSDKAANACAYCKQYKRKCNKAMPSCSACTRLRRVCNYSTPDPNRAKPEQEIALLRDRIEQLEQLVDSSKTQTSSPIGGISQSIHSNISSSLFFLDQRAFTHLHCTLEPVSVPLPNSLVDILQAEHDQPQGLGNLVCRYFDVFHGWMPIISKTRMKRKLDHPAALQTETAFLLACMKLLLQSPENSNTPGDLSLYRALKAMSMHFEGAGLQSLSTIQGGILIAAYELGHAIYPAAYINVSQCARQAVSIDLQNREAPQFLQPWADWEEEIRVWWFIVMLDRHVTVGRELRPLCTEDPKKLTPLPADTEAWDDGAMLSPERLYVSSSVTAVTSPYARLAQAYNLLGRVIRHCDDQNLNLAFILEEMTTLHQATSALVKLTSNEESTDSHTALAVCFSALFKLHKNFLYNSFHQKLPEVSDPHSHLISSIRTYTENSLNTMRDTSLQAVSLALSLEKHGIEKMSPLVLHCLYRAAFWLSYLAGVNREERFVAGRVVLDRVLSDASSRWKLADTYLEMLRAVYKEDNSSVLS